MEFKELSSAFRVQRVVMSDSIRSNRSPCCHGSVSRGFHLGWQWAGSVTVAASLPAVCRLPSAGGSVRLHPQDKIARIFCSHTST
jgi:hypothetical protein